MGESSEGYDAVVFVSRNCSVKGLLFISVINFVDGVSLKGLVVKKLTLTWPSIALLR